MGDMMKDLKAQGVAILVMVSIAVLTVLGMIVLAQFQSSAPQNSASASVNTTIAAFIAGFALVGTFATVTMLIIIVKGIIGVVRNLN